MSQNQRIFCPTWFCMVRNLNISIKMDICTYLWKWTSHMWIKANYFFLISGSCLHCSYFGRMLLPVNSQRALFLFFCNILYSPDNDLTKSLFFLQMNCMCCLACLVVPFLFVATTQAGQSDLVSTIIFH